MSLVNLISEGFTPDADPGYISDAAMETLNLAILAEGLNPDEIAELVEEGVELEGILEAQKNIVRLNKQAKLNRAYKTAILQCAAEDKRKEYKKLRTLWKMEAVLFKKLERQYKNKAMARAKVAIKNLSKKSKTGIVGAAANRVGKAIDKQVSNAKNSLQRHVDKAEKKLKSAIIK